MGKWEADGKFFSVIFVFCLFLMVGLDVIAGFVAMEAEVAQQEVKTRKAFVLGLIALGCLLAAHFIAVMIGYTISTIFGAATFSEFEIKTTILINMACLSLTWIVATAGAGILTMGIWTNRDSRSERGFTNKHFMSFGGGVCFLHAIVSLVMYLANLISRTSTIIY